MCLILFLCVKFDMAWREEYGAARPIGQNPIKWLEIKLHSTPLCLSVYMNPTHFGHKITSSKAYHTGNWSCLLENPKILSPCKFYWRDGVLSSVSRLSFVTTPKPQQLNYNPCEIHGIGVSWLWLEPYILVWYIPINYIKNIEINFLPTYKLQYNNLLYAHQNRCVNKVQLIVGCHGNCPIMEATRLHMPEHTSAHIPASFPFMNF